MRWPSVISVSLALALAGCGDKEATKLTKVKDAVCACKDTKCAELAMKELPQGKVKAGHRSQLIAHDMLDCLAKLDEAERPQTGPDVPAPETAGSASDPGTAAPASARTP